MAMTVTIQIALDESGTYSDAEAAVIKALAQDVNGTAAPAEAAAPAPTAAAPTKAPAPAKTAAPAKAAAPARAPKATVSTRAAVLEDEPVEEAQEEAVEEAEDDLLGGEEEAVTTYTKEDAISAATKLVSNQKQAVVKAALVKAGAKKVSDLNDSSSIQVFMAALEG